ncbi:lytic murein transglycosylase [Methylosinus sp. Sm6]|nr:lytic murein transglycosylase [Methylosinus sp. Sm6]
MAVFIGVLGLCCSAAAAPEGAGFGAFVQDLWPAARDAGVSREIFDKAVEGLSIEPGVLQRPRAQAEFTVTIPSYLSGAITSARVARGRALSAELATPLARIEERSGAPSETLLAILGVESNFGSATGAADTLRVLATLAYGGHRGAVFADEFVAALVMLKNGYVTRERLRGSWAGAMGQPQFLPSAYLKYAQSYDGERPADIWTNRLDSLASIGNFLRQSGWVAGLPAVIEVVVPRDFDYAALDHYLSQWRSLGFSRADGAALPASGAASLFQPAGAAGPAFLITENFEAIRQYNTSDAYALSVALLAERIGGRQAPIAAWPKVAALSTADCMAMQRLLAARGFYHGTIDGKLGRTSRNAVHAFQLSVGMQPADGFATKDVLERLQRGRANSE